ncbi:MAG: GNAT family N-acetyltransferase [Gemmatimonadota bacterium]|nr:GNAT family N-acetyltransferase [Gemmatimonadota bacterium]
MVTLRRAVSADEPALLRLATRLGDFPVPPWRTASEIATADHPILLASLRSPATDNALFVADDLGALLGFVFVVVRTDYFTHERYAYVEDLALAVKGEGRGLARRLMEEAEGWARSLGFRRIGLSVWFQNLRARGLYERLGYQPETMQYLKAL